MQIYAGEIYSVNAEGDAFRVLAIHTPDGELWYCGRVDGDGGDTQILLKAEDLLPFPAANSSIS